MGGGARGLTALDIRICPLAPGGRDRPERSHAARSTNTQVAKRGLDGCAWYTLEEENTLHILTVIFFWPE